MTSRTAPTHRQPEANAARATVVRVAVPKPLPGLFDYALPAHLPAPAIGARVRVPFGSQRLIAICVGLNPQDAHSALKPLDAVLDSENVLGQELFDLALWAADYYHHPKGEVFASMLPVDARKGADLAIERPETWTLLQPDVNLDRAPRQRALVAFLAGCGGTATVAQLHAAGFDRTGLRSLASKGIISRPALVQGPQQPEPQAAEVHTPSDAPLTLNAEQQQALDALLTTTRRFAPTLLEGITGSGKTEVYLRMIETVRSQGDQVLVLVPEIALTPQTVARFVERFGSAAALHSNLTDRQRLQTWLKCRAGEVGILIGTRSAIFTPFKRLGLIVVDEEHDASFKQQEGLRYSARDLAVKRANQLAIPLLLGSATPSFESLHNVATGRYQHHELTQRAGHAIPPTFQLLDIRGQPQTDGISDALARTIRRHLDAKGQVLVFLNRRGFAPGLLCTRCAWCAQCPHCEMRMTLHRQPEALICHHCNRRERPPARCPGCSQATLIAVGTGTQRAEAGLAEMFPETPLYRIDRDTTRSHRRLEAQLDLIQGGKPAILVGTQMLAKGHHFPAVTLVAVINADGGFLSPDFRAPERTAQLIIQVAGRAGRADRPGEVYIQTYQPDSPLLQSLIEDGYQGFARRELETRKQAGLPPYRHMALLRAEAPQGARALQFLTDARATLNGDVERLGPAPAPIPRVADRLRFQLLLLADRRGALHRQLNELQQALSTGTLVVPAGVRWSLDVDPYDTF